jgi:hypothetical protein
VLEMAAIQLDSEVTVKDIPAMAGNIKLSSTSVGL